MWADNRRGTAEENARYQFEHRGADLGATTLDDYLTRVHAFFDMPPKDTETMIRSSNGDVLVYSPGSNLFGVMRKDGAPRLLMKPPGGRAYWEAQKGGDSAGGDRRSDVSAR
jgi:pyocin large subunit-like protein